MENCPPPSCYINRVFPSPSSLVHLPVTGSPSLLLVIGSGLLPTVPPFVTPLHRNSTHGLHIPVSSSARNLGFIFDSDMSFTDQINSLSKSCHFHIRDIRRIRHLLPLSAATALANSLVSSKLDYCNSLYNGICKLT